MSTKKFSINDVFDFVKENNTIPIDDTRRSQDEIETALIEIEEKVWYDRRRNVMGHVNSTGMVTEYEGTPEEEEAEFEIEAKYPASELGPYSDFERGFLAGERSTLRGVLGCE